MPVGFWRFSFGLSASVVFKMSRGDTLNMQNNKKSGSDRFSGCTVVRAFNIVSLANAISVAFFYDREHNFVQLQKQFFGVFCRNYFFNTRIVLRFKGGITLVYKCMQSFVDAGLRAEIAHAN